MLSCVLHSFEGGTCSASALLCTSQVSEAMCRAFKTAGNLDVNSAIVAQLDQVGARLL